MGKAVRWVRLRGGDSRKPTRRVQGYIERGDDLRGRYYLIRDLREGLLYAEAALRTLEDVAKARRTKGDTKAPAALQRVLDP